MTGFPSKRQDSVTTRLPLRTGSTGELRQTAPSFRAAADLGAPLRSPLTS